MVAGDLVNTASRAQALAAPGAVLVGDATRRATEAAIAYEDAGTHELKGKADAVPLWRALRVTAGRRGSLTSDLLEPPFVGRDRELRLLKELFHASADERKAHLVSIVGIAGIGKSRLASELQKYFDGVAQTVQWHRGRCLAYGEGVSYWALAEMVRMRAEIVEGEEPESARVKLRSALERYVDDVDEREWIESRLGQLLALDDRGDGDRADLFAGWRLFLERLAERDPVVLAFEDMQWADAPLLEFIEYLLEWSRGHRLYVLALARPELGERHPGWGGSTRNATTLSVEPLAEEAMGELLDGFVPGLPEDIRRQVLGRAEGVPLYAVETVRMLLDRGLLERHGSEYRPTGPIDSLDVPETLHALVAARLDGLTADERLLLQDAAVVGKTFTREVLVAVTNVDEHEVDRLLQALARKEILSLQVDPRSPERGQYGFLQDLLRQVAYETMPRAERKSRHLAVAAHLERERHDTELDAAEIVASHYLSALALDRDADDRVEIEARALATLVRAGERAIALAAPESAQRYFEQALAFARTTLERAELHERAGLMAIRGDRTGEAHAHLAQAVEGFSELGLVEAEARVTTRLAVEVTWVKENDIERAVSDVEPAFAVLVGGERNADLAFLASQLARLLFFSGRGNEAMERNELALEIAEALVLPEVMSQGLNTKAMLLSARGRHEEAEVLLRHALDVALANGLGESASRAYGNLLYLVGPVGDRWREALELDGEALALARRVGDAVALAWLSGWRSGILTTLGEWDEVLAMTDAIARNRGFQGAHVTIQLERGQRDEVETLMAESAAALDVNELQDLAAHRTLEAFVHLRNGRPEQALAVAEAVWALREDAPLHLVVGGLEVGLDAACELGNRPKLDELLGFVESLPPGEATPSLRVLGARFAARRATLDGDSTTADAGFAAAAEILREIETPFELAVVLLEHAEWFHATGRGTEAEPLLDEARAIFERLRAVPWLERVDRVGLAAASTVVVE
jgi:predicted ATPase